MSLASMTGFARAEGVVGPYRWTWEAKSVNARGLDVRCRVPSGFEALEPAARRLAQEKLRRGNLSVNLNIRREAGESAVSVNQAQLDRIFEIVAELGARNDVRLPSLDGLLALPGVLEAGAEDEAETKAREAAVTEGLGQAIDALAAARRAEGQLLGGHVRRLLDEIESLTGRARATAAAHPEALKKRLTEQVAALLDTGNELVPERLAQEAAVLATKADVREELDRLEAHLEAARALMDEAGSIGRKFDFLCQEFNREANTLCSKSPDIELTRIGLDLKAAIDQLREQVQNVE